MESSRGIELIGLLIPAIWKILHTRTHLSSRADNIEPKKGRLGLQKWLSRLEKTYFFAYLAVRSRVFDVTSGKQFYGPGGPYSNFAGRDASRGLAHGSFDEDMLTKDLDGPLDTLEDLDDEQRDALRGWDGSLATLSLAQRIHHSLRP